MHFVFTTLGYHPESTGGAFRYVMEIAEGLAQRGHEVEAIYPGTTGEPVVNGVTLHRIGARRGDFFSTWLSRNHQARRRLTEIWRKDPAVMIVSCHGYFAMEATRHTGTSVSLFTGPWAEEFLQSDAMSSAAALKLFPASAMRSAERAGLRRSAAIFTISEYYEENLPKWHPGLATPVHVISGGVDAKAFRPLENRLQVRERFGVREGEFVFFALRRLEPRMGLDELVEAFCAIAQEFPSARLWIGGIGSQRQALENLARRFPDRINLLGFVPEEELARRYAAADCTVMPSLDLEGFGLATVESLACGAPVIGSRRGATPEILEPLSRALLFETDELQNKLRDVLQNPTMLPSREQCREYAVSRYTWDRPVETFERICSEIAQGGRV